MRRLVLAGGLVVLLGLTGCFSSSFPLTAPQNLIVGQVHPPAHAPAGPAEYLLSPVEVQRLAAGSSSLAAALETAGSEDQDRRGCSLCAGKRERDQLWQSLRGCAASEIRNQQAGQALQVYYHLAEARGQRSHALAGREIVLDLVRQANELKAKGLKTPPELPSLLDQENVLQADALKASLAAEQLQEKLRHLCGLESTGRACLKTEESFQGCKEVLDEDHCVAVALVHRGDVALLRIAVQQASGRTFQLLQRVLGASNSLLQSPGRLCFPALECLRLLIPCTADQDVEKMTRQFRLLLGERERQVAAEVRAAVREVGIRYEVAGLAWQRVELARRQVAEWEERERKGTKVGTALAQARRDLIKAQSDQLREVIAWEIARVKLRQSQGLLAHCDHAGGAPGCSP
jgi:hypothetical protein